MNKILIFFLHYSNRKNMDKICPQKIQSSLFVGVSPLTRGKSPSWCVKKRLCLQLMRARLHCFVPTTLQQEWIWWGWRKTILAGERPASRGVLRHYNKPAGKRRCPDGLSKGLAVHDHSGAAFGLDSSWLWRPPLHGHSIEVNVGSYLQMLLSSSWRN